MPAICHHGFIKRDTSYLGAFYEISAPRSGPGSLLLKETLSSFNPERVSREGSVSPQLEWKLAPAYLYGHPLQRASLSSRDLLYEAHLSYVEGPLSHPVYGPVFQPTYTHAILWGAVPVRPPTSPSTRSPPTCGPAGQSQIIPRPLRENSALSKHCFIHAADRLNGPEGMCEALQIHHNLSI